MSGQPDFSLLVDPAELAYLAGKLVSEGLPVGFDLESGYEGESRDKAAIHPEENFVVGISFTNSLDWARYIPVRHDSGVNLDNAAVAEAFWLLLTATGADGLSLGVAHHAKFERRTMARWFLRYLAAHPVLGPAVIAARGYPGIRSCTMLESYAEGENRTHGLKDITLANYGIKMTDLLSLFPKGLTQKEQKAIRFNRLNQHDPQVMAYACDDSHKALMHHLDRYPRVRDSLIYKTEMAVLTQAACPMEDTGLDYDWIRMREAAITGSEFADLYLAEVTSDFQELLGAPLPPKFNFNSSQQLSRLLFEDLGMPVVRRSKLTGRPSTDAKVALKGLSGQYPEVQKLLNWKGLTKLHRDFLGKFEAKYSWAADGRAHPSLLQHGTVTGRTSKADPNDQQSPKIKYHYELADGSAQFNHNFRDNIRAPRPGMRLWWQLILEEQGLWEPAPEDDLGWYIIGFDYSQIELRVIAGAANETALIEAFERGEDVHRLTAALMLGKALEDVTDDDRAIGKTMNFALVYGMAEKGLAERLGVSVDEASELFARYHSAYPAIKQWMERTIAASHRDGYVMTRFGRKVMIWEYEDADTLSDAWARRTRREAGERTAGNAPIQGAATGDYKKISMVRAQAALAAAGLADKVLLVMDVHDALEWYARKDVAPETIIAVLQPAVIWPVEGWPAMVADWHVGERFGSLINLELLPDGRVRPKPKKGDQLPLEAIEFMDEDDDTGMPAPPPAQFKFDASGMLAAPPGPQDWEAWETEPFSADGVPRTVIVAVHDMPEFDQARRFAHFLSTLPGENTVILRTPEGDLPIPGTSGLNPGLSAQVSIIFSGAITCYDLDSADMASLAAGLDL